MSASDHVLRDRELGELEPQLEQFTVDPRRSHNGFSLLIRRIRSRSSDQPRAPCPLS